MGIFDSTPLANIFNNGSKDKDTMKGEIDTAQNAYKNLNPPAFSTVNYANPNAVPDVVAQQSEASSQGPSNYGNISVNPQYTQAQADQMAALSNLAKNGGANAQTTANLNQIQQGANANANAQRGAIMQNAQMRGQGGGGQSLLAQLNATQNAQNQANSQGLQVAANNQQTALAAGQGAAGIGANLQNQAWGEQSQAAQAQNAIDQFNAANRTQAGEFNASQGNAIALQNAAKQQQVENARVAALNAGIQQNQIGSTQQNYQNQLSQAGGIANANISGAKMYSDQAAAAAKANQNIWGSLAGLGGQAWTSLGGASGIGSLFGAGGTDAAAGGWAGADMGMAGGGAAAGESAGAGDILAGTAEAAAVAATGGVVPGMAKLPGDSYKNDTVPIKASPGEVVVPRSIAKMGSPDEIARFVKNPPKVVVPNAGGLNAPQQGVISEAGVERPLDQKRSAEMRALHAIANKGRVRI